MNRKDYSNTLCEYKNKKYDGKCELKDCKFHWQTKDKVVCCEAIKKWLKE